MRAFLLLKDALEQISVCARRFSSFYPAVENKILELGLVVIEGMETKTSVQS